ncbi:MAG TPA: hypothetical protein VK966_00160 [Longimicrobiales bacterium]|nr:hypothetical protein [Longimicrobiales bacterium]
MSRDGREYEEVEFGVWVERPDPANAPPCGVQWNGEWARGTGPRPRCFRPAGHDGEHHETVKAPGRLEWREYYWTDDPAAARVEVRQTDPADTPRPDTDPS